MARNRNSNESEAPVDSVEKTEDSASKLPDNAAPNGVNFNNNTRAEEVELNRTVDTETGEVIENATGSNTKDGDSGDIPGRDLGPSAPGTDNSTAELVKVKTTGDFLFHDPFTATTVDNSEDGGNKDGIVRTALVQNALDDKRLEEI